MKKFKCLLIKCLLLFAINAFSQNLSKQIQYLKKNAREPSTYLLEKFDEYDVILLGEDHVIKNNLMFVSSLIPKLHEKGVYNLGMEFGASEMQSRMDSIVLAPAYNEQMVRDMMFFYNVGWAYKEYMDIVKQVWEFNQTLSAEETPFSIINISYQYNWTVYSGGTNAYEMPEVFYRGHPNYHRRDVIQKEVLDRDEKILVLIGIPHAFIRYHEAEVRSDKCYYMNNSLGNLLAESNPGKVYSIMLHAPFRAQPGGPSYFVSPGNQKIEVLMNQLNYQPMGFDLFGTPIGDIRDDSYLSICYEDFKLGDIFEGYIFLAPFHQLEGCEVDHNYFQDRSWDEIKRMMPDPHWHGSVESLEQYWQQITGYTNVNARYQQVFLKD